MAAPDSPGMGREAKLAVRACRTDWSCCCRARVCRSSCASSCSSFSLAQFMLSVCFCRMAFCSSNSVFILRRRRSSASRAAGTAPCPQGQTPTPLFQTQTPSQPRLFQEALCHQRPGSSQDLLPPSRLPRHLPQPLPLFWSKNSSVKMGTSKVEKVSLHSPA